MPTTRSQQKNTKPSTMKQINFRADEALVARIDERAEKVGMSRNEWVRRVTEWALEQPVTARKTTINL